MKKAISLLTAAILTMIAALPAGAAPATGDEVLTTLSVNAEQSVNGGFDVGLATTLIVVICSILTVAIAVVAIYLAKKNRNN